MGPPAGGGRPWIPSRVFPAGGVSCCGGPLPLGSPAANVSCGGGGSPAAISPAVGVPCRRFPRTRGSPAVSVPCRGGPLPRGPLPRSSPAGGVRAWGLLELRLDC